MDVMNHPSCLSKTEAALLFQTCLISFDLLGSIIFVFNRPVWELPFSLKMVFFWAQFDIFKVVRKNPQEWGEIRESGNVEKVLTLYHT